MLATASTRLLSAGATLLSLATQYPAFGVTTPWQAHYNRVRGLGGATAAATVDMPFVQAYFEQAQALGLNVLADLSPRFGYVLDGAGRVSRLFEPQAKDLVAPPGYVGPTVATASGHAVLSFDGSSLLTAANEQDYDLLTGDLVSYVYANASVTNVTTTIYSKSVANDQPDRYALIYDGGQLYSLYTNTLQYNAFTTAMPPGAWRELGQRVRRQVVSNELVVSRQAVASTSFAIESEVYDSIYQFALGAYQLPTNPGEQKQFSFAFSGLLDRLRLLRSWPGATADTTIWNTLIA
jgi:hypothetical protein